MKAVAEELARVVEAAEAKLRAVTDGESRAPLLDGGWSRKQLLGHLIDSATNNHQRFVRASLQTSLDFPAYEQEEWVNTQAPQEAAWGTLVGLWASYNRYLIHVIEHLPPGKLDTKCRIGSNQPVTLKFLVEDYLRHLVHHLEQIDSVPAAH